MRKSDLIVNGSSLSRVEYQGQRVVTFEMVDCVHNKRHGTARRAFNRNRVYFREGKDFIIAPAALMRQIVPLGLSAPNRGQILLTETGYLLLVKSFSDPVSWQIQSQLVEVYFRAVPEFPELHHVAVPDVGQLAEMPLQDAQHAIAHVERESFHEHGQRGSQAMTLRRKEKKKLSPVLAVVQGWSQPQLTGFDAACPPEEE